MRKITISLLAALSAITFAAPVSAVPAFAPNAPQASSDVVEVQHRRDRRDRRHFRSDRRGAKGHWRGHRGHHRARPGYRRHSDGMWYPLAAFGLGAIIGGAIANQPPIQYRPRGDAHISWCYDRYRSYRASDNTFQPYNGPRRQCRSPYG